MLSIVYLTRRRHYEGSAYQTFSNLTVATQPPGEQFRYRNLGGGLTRSASSPRIAAAANGTTTVLWGENVYAGRGEIHTSTRPPAGDYPQRSTKISTGNARTASLATATDGTAVAVWFITDKDNETRLRTASMRP